MTRWILASGLLLLAGLDAVAREPIRLANNPALSPDGKRLAFDWNGDIWLASSTGGEARPLTTHAARDSQPKFSPDGNTIAFISDRDGSPQVFTIVADGGQPVPLTHHTAGYFLREWTPDGQSLLVQAIRDDHWRHGERFFTIRAKERSAETMLFDDYGADGSLSPDGNQLLFTREGEAWWRKGYTGSRVAQIWRFDGAKVAFTKVVHGSFGARAPLWRPDSKGFYYVAEHAHGADLAFYDFSAKSSEPLTRFKQDSVVFPCIARDGSCLVFRHLFDLYRFEPATGKCEKLDLWHNSDRAAKKTDQRLLSTATAVSFTRDGLEIAMIAGGDLWVMDTELREPKQITRTATDEASPLFTTDGNAILFSSTTGDRFAINRATRKDEKQFWWQNASFTITPLAEMDEPPSRFKLSPDGKQLAYVRGRGDLWVLDLDGGKQRRVFAGWSTPDFDWSPDGQWFVYAQEDADFNRDIWLRRADGSGTPYNLSRHPFNEGMPAWSPDGKTIAFYGQRAAGEAAANLCTVSLRAEDDERTSRDRKLEKALEKMKSRPGGMDEVKDFKGPAEPEVVIDWERLHERIRRIPLGSGFASALFWSPDSKKLAFTGSFDGKPGTYFVDMNETTHVPKPLTTTVGTQPVWLKQGNQIVWLVGGVPTSTPGTVSAAATATPATPAEPPPIAPKGPFKGKPAAPAATATGGGYMFSVRQTIDVPGRHAAVFDTCWRIMRDNWYDSNLGNNDWNAIRVKYRDMARRGPDLESVATLVQLMLGELNGSHLGFTLSVTDPKQTIEVRDTTAHLGVRFDRAFAGPGLKIRDVLPGGPADRKLSRLNAGEIILKIDGAAVDVRSDLTAVLNGPADRTILLTVQDGQDKLRDVFLRPTSYVIARVLLYDQWLQHNRKVVADASGGKLGYLHISAMSMPTFRKFEEELVSQGAGKQGLIIDVRENGGGSTADHLLTTLTQPQHAITVPRGGGPGYPHDRKVYVSWNKPIAVLCNQNSFSNAEIFTHAIKTLKRGPIIGTPTAGGVISTGAVGVMDVGMLRLPFRGWFGINDGEDMELHGAVPQHVIWPEPGAVPRGHDAQLLKAIEVLQADVQRWLDRPQPKLRKASERS
jgi:tricorn protease